MFFIITILKRAAFKIDYERNDEYFTEKNYPVKKGV